jgi:1-deoxy-D-xylulose-5-phosphate reductoisomerase
VAVENFLGGYMRFTDIAPVIEATLEAHSVVGNPSLEQVLEADEWARRHAEGLAKKSPSPARTYSR